MAVRLSDKIFPYNNSGTTNVNNKFLAPLIETNKAISEMSKEERIEFIKVKYNLTHGKGKRKSKNKKKRR